MHTPGPWDYKRTTIGHPDNAINPMVTSDGGQFIARIGWEGSTVPYMSSLTPHTFDEAEANARLIAAAPDLLKAAEFALKVFENANIDGNWWVPSRDAIKAAIAKATEPS